MQSEIFGIDVKGNTIMSRKGAALGSVSKAVIPAAGLGARLLSATKEQPKEMLPLFASEGGMLCLKPAVQQIFEQLYDFGLREFCIIVGKGKRAIEDHFTPDRAFVHRLNTRWLSLQAVQLQRLYNRIEQSTIYWANQPEPRGFGHAVLQAEAFVSEETFLLQAGDTVIMSPTNPIYSRLIETHFKTGADATLAIRKVPDPKRHGIVTIRESAVGPRVISVEEKPARPKSHLGIMPLYVFSRAIFKSLEKVKKDRSGEIQLTDAIQGLLDSGHTVQAISLRKNDLRLDIGTPETYWEALELSYRMAKPSLKSRRTMRTRDRKA